MNIYSYVVARDYGFAPNPFGDFCTLATCKPRIRKYATIGDWVVGTGSAKHDERGKLVFAMRVDEILNFNEYWDDSRFQYKKPVFNGSLKQMYGDNIYHYSEEQGEWIQENSHHSKPNGERNEKNYERDLSSKNVLISKYFWYYGNNAINMPSKLRNKITKKRQGYKKINNPDIVEEFITWLKDRDSNGYHGHPKNFELDKFERYEG